ncbi:AAA family ATPase [Spirosoma rhododendri]|uniref:ATP-binding protein n=1 Tax=Spirosoma rhododendri TaxID=2728024 RepID=A0A7L5DGP8_9BACT|nr:ATP-binding protein [Spirosoma rhododendri]QJD77434.1 ATP-binding protein [Spirosoma rhododendri]
MAQTNQPPVQITQQRLISMQIKRLKSLVDVRIVFEDDKPLTAIMGPNGFGKSTILHLLASSFQPTNVRTGSTQIVQGEEWQYVNFFPSTPDGTWSSSQASITHTYRTGAKENREELTISKSIRYWLPKIKSKPHRETYYVGVKESVPEIEKERILKNVKYKTKDQVDAQSEKIRKKVGEILKREYSKSYINQLSGKRSLLGVKYGVINYSSLSMGAGEQRLFKLIETLEKAGKYALILIDELDLLLHTDALNRLLKVLKEYALSKSLQIIFTTHRESVTDVDFSDYIAVRHLYHSLVAPYKTLCFNDTKPEALARLTGTLIKDLEIFCEDDMAKAIIEKLAFQVDVARFLAISSYGPAINSFTYASAFILKRESDGTPLDKTLFVLDGDEYATLDERKTQIKRILTGNEGGQGGLGDRRRAQALDLLTSFNSPDRKCPEEMLYNMVRSISLGVNDQTDQVLKAAAEASGEIQPKQKVEKTLEYIGGERSRALGHFIDVAAQSHTWPAYTEPVRQWLEVRKTVILEQH